MITGVYAALCGLLLVVLYVRVSQRWLATKIGAGTGGDAVLEQRGVMVRAVRMHAQPVGECRRHPYRMPCLAAAVTAWLAATARRVPPESGALSAMQIR